MPYRVEIKETHSDCDVVLLFRSPWPASSVASVEDLADAFEMVLEFLKALVQCQRLKNLHIAIAVIYRL